MIYLFHNIYGDADELIATKPVDCEAVPFGWTPEIEEYRNNLTAQLNCTVSALPSVVYYQAPYTLTVTNTLTNEVTTMTFGDKWEEVSVLHMDKPWTWVAIQEEINRDKNRTVVTDGSEQ
jgi:hypothetical protein